MAAAPSLVAFSQALYQGINPRGGEMQAVQIGNGGRVHQGIPRPPCRSCAPLADAFGYNQ